MEKTILKDSTIVTQERFRQFVERLRNAKPSEKNADKYDSHNGSESFTGTPDFNSALDLCDYGWDTGIRQLQADADLMVGAGPVPEFNKYKGRIHVGAYLAGRQDCKIRFSMPTNVMKERLSIFVPLTYSSYITQKKALQFAQEIVKLVNFLQSKYDVQIVGCFGTSDSTKSFNQVILKNFGEVIVLNNMAAAFHPSFFRRLYFAHLESQNDFKIGWGYGSPMGIASYKRIIKQLGYSFETAIVLPRLNDIDNDIKSLNTQYEFISEDEFKNDRLATNIKSHADTL